MTTNLKSISCFDGRCISFRLFIGLGRKILTSVACPSSVSSVSSVRKRAAHNEGRMDGSFDGGSDLGRVDHLIYGTPNLSATVDELEKRFGLRAATGGRHPGEGTYNALYSLGPGRYLEIMAPDPNQSKPDRPRWLGLDDLMEPRLVAWAAKAQELEETVRAAASSGVELGEIRSGGRERPDGTFLNWRLTDPHRQIAAGVVPFLIDWGRSPHPSAAAVQGVELLDFRLEHPDTDYVRRALDALGLPIQVTAGRTPLLVAILDTPRGTIELT